MIQTYAVRKYNLWKTHYMLGCKLRIDSTFHYHKFHARNKRLLNMYICTYIVLTINRQRFVKAEMSGTQTKPSKGRLVGEFCPGAVPSTAVHTRVSTAPGVFVLTSLSERALEYRLSERLAIDRRPPYSSSEAVVRNLLPLTTAALDQAYVSRVYLHASQQIDGLHVRS